MCIALLNLLNVDVLNKIKELVPIEDITVKVLHLSHACQLELDEYCFEVLVGTTVARRSYLTPSLETLDG